MRYFLILLISIFASACSSKTTVRHSSNYQAIIAQGNHEILILPPTVAVNSVDIAGKKTRMYDYELFLESIIHDQLIPALQEQGLRPKVIKRKDLFDQHLLNENNRLLNSFDEANKELYKETLWKTEEAFNISKNLGQFAVDIGSKNQTDLLIALDYARDVKTNGARTKDFMVDLLIGGNNFGQADASIIIVGIIDAKTGNLLWSNLGSDLRGGFSLENLSSEEKAAAGRIKEILETIFKPFKEEPKK